MKSMRIAAIAGLLALVLSGCATSFTGSAHVEGGGRSCEAKCKAQGMELAGMVFMGEYTDGCICALPGRAASSKRTLLLASAESAGGATGVMMQMQRQQQQQQGH